MIDLDFYWQGDSNKSRMKTLIEPHSPSASPVADIVGVIKVCLWCDILIPLVW
jgi:hypothetical protein